MSQPIIATLLLYAAILVLAAAAAWDAATLTIPNFLPIALVALYIAARGVNFVPSEILFDLLAAAIVFGVGFALFAMGWMGGGDVKLAPGAVLWAGYEGLLPFVIA